jgi:hypothetical protein
VGGGRGGAGGVGERGLRVGGWNEELGVKGCFGAPPMSSLSANAGMIRMCGACAHVRTSLHAGERLADTAH